MSRWDYWDGRFPPQSVPRAAKGGIRAQSKRGSFGESWWAKRWMAVLDSFDIGARLSRGRSYARRGQVLSIEFAKGTVTSQVQGSRPTPYEVTITVKTLKESAWKKVAQAVSNQAIYAAKLLAGELPEDIEQLFTAQGVSLFPERLSDLTTDCSCPDWSNPCKHIAAVYCLLGEEFDRDPFLIFKMRGMSREEFGRLLADFGETLAAPAPVEEVIPPEPLPTDPARFWSLPQFHAGMSRPAQRPAMAAALVRRLGNFPFWRGQQPFLDAMESTYEQASVRVLDEALR
jgi:uncharacterized Zn finger protein